jgi:hypothetical protein
VGPEAVAGVHCGRPLPQTLDVNGRTARALTDRDVRLLRARAQLLDKRAIKASVPDVLRAVCGVQAQLLSAAQLSIRARSQDLTMKDVDRARQWDRTCVWTWCMRGTLHLIASDDVGVILPLVGPVLAPLGRRRLAQLGLDDDASNRGVRIIKGALSSNGPMTREQVGESLRRRMREKFDEQAVVHLLGRAALEGVVCRGPNSGRQETYVLLSDWISAPPAPPKERALADLARRYVEAFGPARPEDFAAWSGLNRAFARKAWVLIADELAEVSLGGRRAWTAAGTRKPRHRSTPVVRLVPNFDTYLLGYEDRKLTVDEKYSRRILRGGGWVHPAVIRDGLAVATWRYDGKKDVVVVEPFGRQDSSLQPLLRIEVEDVGRFLGTEPLLEIRDSQRKTS